MTERVIPTPGLTTARWCKSSYSAADNECVEVALADGVTGIRDSKVPHGPELALAPAAFTAFLDGVKGRRVGRVD